MPCPPPESFVDGPATLNHSPLLQENAWVQQVLTSTLCHEASLNRLIEEHERAISKQSQDYKLLLQKMDAIEFHLGSMSVGKAAATTRLAGEDTSGTGYPYALADSHPSKQIIIPKGTNSQFTKQITTPKCKSISPVSSVTRSQKHMLAIQAAKTHFEVASAKPKGPCIHATPAIVHWCTNSLLHVVTSAKFEYMMGVVILLHLCILGIRLQWRGNDVAQRMGIREARATTDTSWSEVESGFVFIERSFNMLYFMELIVRLCVFRTAFFNVAFNVIDGLVIVATCVDSFLLSQAQQRNEGFTLIVIRVIRSLRVFRFIRLARYTEHLRQMHILVRTLLMSFMGLGCSMVLVIALMLAGAVLLAQTTQEFLEDETVGIERRVWLFDHFGTTTQCLYTLFECTFSAVWTKYSRSSYQDVSVIFLFFWIPWVLIVNFTVLRVVSALFLKHAMTVAAIDAERAAMENLARKRTFAEKLRVMFNAADTSGDGLLTPDEFDEMLHNAQFVEHFKRLDLEVEEVDALFSVCSAEDGAADYEELLSGALKMKGSARTIDTIQIMQKQLEMHRQLKEVLAYVHYCELAVDSRQPSQTLDRATLSVS